MEQFCHAVPLFDNCNSTTVGMRSGWEAEIARRPVGILVAAILPQHDVLDDALLHLGRFGLVAFGDGRKPDFAKGRE